MNQHIEQTDDFNCFCELESDDDIYFLTGLEVSAEIVHEVGYRDDHIYHQRMNKLFGDKIHPIPDIIEDDEEF